MSNNPPALYPDNPLTRALTDRNGSPVTGTPLPSTRSAVLGRAVTAPPELTSEEREELDRKAVELGIMPKPDFEASKYRTLTDALNAGASVAPPARSFAPVEYRLPDFSKVGAIDLVRNVVIVGDLEFAITLDDSERFKKFAINVARNAIEKQFTDALRSLQQGDKDGLSAGEDVQQVQEKEKPS